MKILIMCEGSNELKVINMLLDADKLRFTRDDILDMRPFHARQLTSPQLKPALDSYHGPIEAYWIGDKMTDNLKDQKYYLNIVSVRKYCTLPELEMLLIIAEGLFDDYEKVKSKQKPKEFCKNNSSFNRKRHNTSTEFYDNYFFGHIDLLVGAIIEYRRLHSTHKKGQGYIADLLKGTSKNS